MGESIFLKVYFPPPTNDAHPHELKLPNDRAFVLNRERFNTNTYRNGRAFVLNRERFNTNPLALFVLNRSRFNTKYKMHANFKLNRSMAGLLY